MKRRKNKAVMSWLVSQYPSDVSLLYDLPTRPLAGRLSCGHPSFTVMHCVNSHMVSASVCLSTAHPTLHLSSAI